LDSDLNLAVTKFLYHQIILNKSYLGSLSSCGRFFGSCSK